MGNKKSSGRLVFQIARAKKGDRPPRADAERRQN